MVKSDFQQEVFNGQSDCKSNFNSEQSCQDGKWVAPFNDTENKYWTEWVRQNEKKEDEEEEMDSQLYASLLKNYVAKNQVKVV